MVPEHLQMRPPGIYHDGLVELASWLPKDSIIAEIGSYCGESSRIFLNSKNVRLLFCIDPWVSNYDPNDLIYGKDLGEVERVFDEHMFGYNSFIKVKQKSIDAVKMFPDNLFDSIYIDGMHTYEAVKSDLIAYRSKVKQGGWIMGHDWGLPGVQNACKEYFQKDPWSVFNDGSWIYPV